MKKCLILFSLILITCNMFAGEGFGMKDNTSSKLISGKVIDKKSGEEIAGAEIKINDKIIYSDLNGNFSAIISLAKTKASITSISYKETKINIDPFSYTGIIVELASE